MVYSQFFICSNPHVDRCSNPLPWDSLSSPSKEVGPLNGGPFRLEPPERDRSRIPGYSSMHVRTEAAAARGRAKCPGDFRFHFLLFKVLQISPRALNFRVLDPMRSSSFFHWRTWIRAYKLMRAVRVNKNTSKMPRRCTRRCSRPAWRTWLVHT